MGLSNKWKEDNYKFVGKAFDYAYADRSNQLSEIMGEVTTDSVDYELKGRGGYGPLQPYEGRVLTMGEQKRGFNTIVYPQEFSLSDQVDYIDYKRDKSGELKRVGSALGDSAKLTVYQHKLQMFEHAFNSNYQGGDGKPWAATDHPVASKAGVGRKRVADDEAGTFSNLLTDQLSVAAINKAQYLSMAFVTPGGLPYMCEYDMVLVSPNLQEKARKLFGSHRQLMPTKDPESDFNAANAVYDIAWMIVGNGRDGLKGNQWAICDKRLMKQQVVTVFNQKPIVFQTDMDNPLVDMYTAYAAWGTGWGDARMITFSNP